MGRDNMGASGGFYEYMPMTQEDELHHKKMLRRQRLLGIRVQPTSSMSSYEWEALNGWHGKKELLKYQRNRCVISWTLFLAMVFSAVAIVYFVFVLLSSPVDFENPTPFQGQEQRNSRQQERRQSEQYESLPSSSEEQPRVPPYMMPGMGTRMKF